eukprot:Gb_16712 [translate_table: standard]
MHAKNNFIFESYVMLGVVSYCFRSYNKKIYNSTTVSNYLQLPRTRTKSVDKMQNTVIGGRGEDDNLISVRNRPRSWRSHVAAAILE